MLQKVGFRTFYLLKVPSDLLKPQKVALIWNFKNVKLGTNSETAACATSAEYCGAVYDLGATILTYTTRTEAR